MRLRFHEAGGEVLGHGWLWASRKAAFRPQSIWEVRVIVRHPRPLALLPVGPAVVWTHPGLGGLWPRILQSKPPYQNLESIAQRTLGYGPRPGSTQGRGLAGSVQEPALAHCLPKLGLYLARFLRRLRCFGRFATIFWHGRQRFSPVGVSRILHRGQGEIRDLGLGRSFLGGRLSSHSLRSFCLAQAPHIANPWRILVFPQTQQGSLGT